MTKENLLKEYDRLQQIYGDNNLHSVYGAGCETTPDVCLVFINPTARNNATNPTWTGIRAQWIGTKQVWSFLTECGLFSEELNNKIEAQKTAWTPEFASDVYKEVAKNKVYITNLAKCTQADARELPTEVFKAYRDLLLAEIDLIKPKKILFFGNLVASVTLGQKISVGTSRQKQFILKTPAREYESYAVYYPVGNGRFNAPKAIEDVRAILKK